MEGLSGSRFGCVHLAYVRALNGHFVTCHSVHRGEHHTLGGSGGLRVRAQPSVQPVWETGVCP